MSKPKMETGKILHDLKNSLDQMRRVIVMVEEGRYAIDVIHQSKAVQKALKKTDNLILKNHLQTCVLRMIQEKKGKMAGEEIMKIVKMYNYESN